MRAYIIGNGTSRKEFDLEKLKGKGTIYGCNALYRDFTPDILIVNDPWMTKEIFDSGYTGNLWCRRVPDGYKHNQVYDLTHPGQHWATGPTAVYIASKKHDKLYILGFDFAGTKDGSINNLYVDTPNYRKRAFKAPDYKDWLKNILEVIENNKEKSFTFVGTNQLTEFKKHVNINIIDYETFEQKLQEIKYFYLSIPVWNFMSKGPHAGYSLFRLKVEKFMKNLGLNSWDSEPINEHQATLVRIRFGNRVNLTEIK